MDLPKRSLQHISETNSYRIFEDSLPEHWIVREVTGRDYGIDCYVELLSNNHRLTCDLVSFQIKSKKNIKWNKNGTFKLTGIKESTVNYWYKFSVPVFICLVDTIAKKSYFLSLKKYIREHFDLYLNEYKISFLFNKENELSKTSDSLNKFIYQYFFDNRYEILARDIVSFISNYHFYQAEDGIRDKLVTGVQTCALPISRILVSRSLISSCCVGWPFGPATGVVRRS